MEEPVNLYATLGVGRTATDTEVGERSAAAAARPRPLRAPPRLPSHPPLIARPPAPRSVLLKDSFVDSFPPRDRPFMRQFAETQMFSVYTDAVIGP